jgi:hypothetical protein
MTKPKELTLKIDSTLKCYLSSEIKLPIQSFDQIKEWFIKWDTFHYTTDNKTWHEVELNNSDIYDSVDWKDPFSTVIMNKKGEIVSRQE